MTSDTAAEALVAAEESGTVCRLEELGPPDVIGEATLRLADTPLAPLAARAIARAVAEQPSEWSLSAIDFAGRLSSQSSYLALAETIDVMLEEPATASLVASTMHATLLRDHDSRVNEQPQIGAHRLEGALRIALADEVPPYLVLHHLAADSSSSSDAYVVALPRLIGIALDRWDGDEVLTGPLVAALNRLQDHGVAAAGATYELGCRELRAALRVPHADVAYNHFESAARRFLEAVELDPDRDDAVAYAAVCRAVLAFARGDLNALESATETAEAAIRQRIVWHVGLHHPSWRQPSLGAEVEWLGLMIDLRQAMARLMERSWLHVSAAIGQLARVYSAERGIRPVAGLSGVVRPVIENRLIENAVLLDQLSRAIQQDRSTGQRHLPPGADVLYEAITQYVASGPVGVDGNGRPEAVPTPDGLEGRVHEFAGQLDELPGEVVEWIARVANDEELAQITALLVPAVSPGIESHPALSSMRQRIVAELGSNPAFRGEAAAVVTALLEATLTFLLDRYDRSGPVIPGLKDILRPLGDGESPPAEKELQLQFYVWLAGSREFAGRVSLETPDVATGRVDVIVRVGDVQVVTEVKRELKNASKSSLEQQYVSQTSAYSGSNVPFSQLLVLDLTDHSDGVPSLTDLAWVVEDRVSEDATSRHIVAAVVVGNRVPPSALS